MDPTAVHPFPSTVDKPKSEMTDAELLQHEQDEFECGPMRLLTESCRARTPVLVLLRNDHRLLGYVRAFDRHCNMVMQECREIWREGAGRKKRTGKGRKRAEGVDRERFVSKLFVRGDSVVVIVRPPEATQ